MFMRSYHWLNASTYISALCMPAVVEHLPQLAKVEGSSLFSAAAIRREKTVNKVEASFVLCNV